MGGSDLFTGTLELLILRVLASEAMHGFGIGRILRETSSGVLDVAEGVLYPALHRLHARGLIGADWGRTEAGRRAKYYHLTAKGTTPCPGLSPTADLPFGSLRSSSSSDSPG